ncbi:MAG: YihY/virulence factor BrkB family protein [Lachnospiraceae bacterium]|nr:YihY/virulence factor BrkB family protein [Lachnospiraceae bacterium]
MLKLISFVLDMGNRIANHHLSAYAAQAAFFTVLSFFPFIMSIINLVQFLPVSDTDITNMILSFIPEVFSEYVEPIITETLANSNGAVLSISVLVTIWCASKGVMSVKNGFNTITDYRKSTNYIVVRLVSTIYTLIFAFALIFIVVVMVFGNRILHTLMVEYEFLADIGIYFGAFRVIIVICVLLLFFLIFYRFLPDQKDNMLHCMPGAILSTFGWIIISLAFSIYIDNFNNYTVMYGSLTGIILTLLWLYFCMYILFIGSELNNFIFGKEEEQKSYLPL